MTQQTLEPGNHEQTMKEIERLGLTRYNTIRPNELYFLMNRNQHFTPGICLRIIQLTGKIPRYYYRKHDKLGVRHWVKIRLY